MNPSVYDDMKKLHEMVKPFKSEVYARRSRRLNKAMIVCVDAITELANSVSDGVASVTDLICAFKER